MDTKKLRQKILDLAIRGKLVPQDPNDEPASVLLERIRAERERLIKEGKIKRSKKTVTDDEIEAPFEIPESWEWVRLCDITELIEDCPHSTAKDEGHGYPLIRTPNVGEGYLILDGVHRVSESVYNKRNARAVPETNDIIYAREAPAGNAAVIKENEIVCLGQRTVLIRPFKEYINSKLLAYFIISPHSRNSLISTAVGSTATHVNLESIRPFIIPIPPLSEQIRIVWSIERWFTLIDELESNEGDLLKAIDKAKSKILDLAIHGKLVPQDPNDEPAIDLLKRINPKFEPCDMEKCPFAIPDSWCWTIFSSVCELITGSTPSKAHSEYYGGEFPFYKPSDLDVGRHVTVPSEYLSEKGKEVSRIIPEKSTAICCIGSIGKCGYIEREGTTNQQINTAVPMRCLYSLYLYYYCNSKTFVETLTEGSSAITISIVNKSKLGKMPISLPPLAEQKRIVAKIEELFAVLDSIKESLEA